MRTPRVDHEPHHALQLPALVLMLLGATVVAAHAQTRDALVVDPATGAVTVAGNLAIDGYPNVRQALDGKLNTAGGTIAGTLKFADSAGTKIDLWGGALTIGVQSATAYFRTGDQQGFAWFTGGSHSDVQNDPGGGQTLMTLTAGGGLQVSRNTSVTGNVTVTGSAGVSGNATVSGNASVSGNAAVTGYVGIGTPSPQQRLDVVGVTRLRSADGIWWDLSIGGQNDGALKFTGQNPGAQAYLRWGDAHLIYSSDRRLKKDILPLDSALRRALQLRPVSYRLRDSPPSAAKTLGFIAQDVEPLLPEAVGHHEGMKSLDYMQLIPVAVGAVQELAEQVERLKAKLDALEREVAGLKQIVNRTASK